MAAVSRSVTLSWNVRQAPMKRHNTLERPRTSSPSIKIDRAIRQLPRMRPDQDLAVGRLAALQTRLTRCNKPLITPYLTQKTQVLRRKWFLPLQQAQLLPLQVLIPIQRQTVDRMQRQAVGPM